MFKEFEENATATADGYTRTAQVAITFGARTALFVPELDRLFIVVRASSVRPRPSGYFGRRSRNVVAVAAKSDSLDIN